MKPVTFEQADTIMTADECMPLPVVKAHNKTFNADEYISCWEMSDEDIKLILKDLQSNRRPRVFLSVIGGQPPACVEMENPLEE